MKKRSWFILLLVLTLALPMTMASAAAYYYVSGTSFLKIRELPNNEAKVKDSYRTDFAVVSYKKYDANWAYVHFSDGAEGYVMRKYLKSSSTSTGYVKKDKTALRAGPAATFTETATLSQGDKVRVLTQGRNWSYVSASAGTGYVRNAQLSDKVVKKSANAGTPYTAWVVNPRNNRVNVRRGPGKGYAVTTELNPGTQVTVEEVEGKWSLISSPVTGYMMSTYISKKAPSGTTPAPTVTPAPAGTGKVRYIVSPDGKTVNLRHGPNEKTYAVRARLDYGTKVTVLSSENGWSRVRTANNLTGYVKNTYLTAVKPGAAPAPEGATPVPTKSTFKPFSATISSANGKSVNLRRDAGAGYATVTQIPNGSKITVTDEKGSWYKVTYSTYSGYVKKEYVKK